MNYLNLTTSLCSNMEFGDCQPEQRGIWLSVMLYCATEENGGVIKGAKALSNRAWIMGCGITKEEALKDNPLLLWDGDDLHASLYPLEQEEALRKKREAGKNKGGRKPKPKQEETHDEVEEKPHDLPSDNHMVPSAEKVIVKESNSNSKGSKEGGKPPVTPYRASRPSSKELIETIPEDMSEPLRLSIVEWAEYKQSLKAREKIQSLKSWQTAIKRMRKFDSRQVSEGIEKSIANGWTGWEHDITPKQSSQATTPNYVKDF